MADNEYIVACVKDLYPLLNRVTDYYDNKGGKGKFKVVIKQYRKQRSIAQNSYYFGVIAQAQLEYYKTRMGSIMWDLAKQLDVEPTIEFIHEFNKIMFLQGKSSTLNDIATQEKFHLDIREHMLHTHGVLIPEPNEETEE